MDRKRTVFLEGVCGQVGKVQIRGQVVDLPIKDGDLQEEWHPFLQLPSSRQKTICSLDDLFTSSVRKPRIRAEILDVSPDDFEVSRPKDYKLLFSLPPCQGDSNGFFSIPIPATLREGSYTVRIVFLKSRSIRQNLKDLRHVKNADRSILQNDIILGWGRVRILPQDYNGLMIVSDIDQTLLDTDFHSRKGILATFTETAQEKKAIQAMPEFYRQMTTHKEDEKISLFFLSASPHFFRRNLASFFEHHSIPIGGMYLKYLPGILDNAIGDLSNSVTSWKNIFQQGSGKWKEILQGNAKDLKLHITALRDQTSYKLRLLLISRLMQPTHLNLILMGDNTESDFLVFGLYQILLMGLIQGEKLENCLEELRFQENLVFTRDKVLEICSLVKKNQKIHGKRNHTVSVWIHNSRKEMNESKMEKLLLDILPSSVQKLYQKEKGQGICPPILCDGGYGFAKAAYEKGFLDQTRLEQVKMAQN